MILLQKLVRRILREAKDGRFFKDPLKPGNVLIFHGTRAATPIWKQGIRASNAGVIDKSGFNAVYAAEDPSMASSKTDYEENLKGQYGKQISKGRRFIVIASVPESDVEVIVTSSDLRIYRDVTTDELVAIFPDQLWWGRSDRFKSRPYAVKPEYKEFITQEWMKP